MITLCALTKGLIIRSVVRETAKPSVVLRCVALCGLLTALMVVLWIRRGWENGMMNF